MLESLKAVTYVRGLRRAAHEIYSDCWSFFGGGRLSAIFETTSLGLDIWNAELYAYVGLD